MIKKSSRKKIDTLAPKILTAQFLLYANALIWFGFSIYIGIDMVKAQNTAYVIFLACFFLLLNAGAMLFCGITIGRHDSWAYYFSIFVIILNGFFTRVGQFEIFDLIAFVVDLGILIFLLAIGRAYLKQS